MGTTATSTQTNAYNPNSMGTYNNLMSQLGNILPGFMNNPFGTQQFKTGQQLGTTQANNLNQSATSGLMKNMIGSGMAGGASNPAATEMLQNQARANTANTANLGFVQPTQQALGTQQAAINTAANFKPLQTGGTNVQSTQGLGTWLPQVLSAGAGILSGGLNNGLFSGGISPAMSAAASQGGLSNTAGLLGGMMGPGGSLGGGMAGTLTPPPSQTSQYGPQSNFMGSNMGGTGNNWFGGASGLSGGGVGSSSGSGMMPWLQQGQN